MLRIGLGYDLHRLAAGKKLVLGGVEIPSDLGCIAHSDGDALVHALIDALVSPCNMGDVGRLFPDTDERYRGASSIELLEAVMKTFPAGTKILSIDSVIVLDHPKLLPYIQPMKERLGKVLAVSPAAIGIKGKTSEALKLYSVECWVNVLMETEA